MKGFGHDWPHEKNAGFYAKGIAMSFFGRVSENTRSKIAMLNPILPAVP